MDTIKKYFRVEREKIALLKFILEAYDGIAVLTTVNAEKGIVVLRIAPQCVEEVKAVVAELSWEMLIEPMNADDAMDKQ